MGIWMKNVELFFSNTDYLDRNVLETMDIAEIESILTKITVCRANADTQKIVINEQLNNLSTQESDLSERLKALAVINSAESRKMTETPAGELCKIRNMQNKLKSECNDIENALKGWESKIHLYAQIIHNRREGCESVSDDIAAEGLMSVPIDNPEINAAVVVRKDDVLREFFKYE